MPEFQMAMRQTVHRAEGAAFDLRQASQKPKDAMRINLREPEQRPATSSESPLARHSSTAKAVIQQKVAKVMREKAAGTLRSSSGKKVTSRAQALAIGYSEGRRAAKKRKG